MTDARKALAEALMRAIDGLTNYADDLDATERPAIGEYDVTADIRLVCQALIDRHAADIAAAALDNLPRVTVREGFERRTGQATPRTLPGTREEVARAAGTQDREAMYHLGVELGALKAIVCGRHYSNEAVGLRVRNCWEVYESGLSALPLAPMPERDGMREMVYANARTTLIGFENELTERDIKFICDQISRKVALARHPAVLKPEGE